jgi:membrane-bound metal-dependent hydrolase YbcI (DUF457 family)
MFIGHFAAAFAAKRAAPATSLGTLIIAAEFVDVLWPVLLISGLERVNIDPGNTAFTALDFVHYPISHSLVSAFVWAVLFGGVYWMAKRYRAGAIATAVLVASHWFLDAVVHRPDLPLAPGSPIRAGLGLWNSVPATIALEGVLFAAGVWLYTSATVARDRIGRYGWWGFVLFLVLVYAANLAGPPPPNVQAIEIAGLAGTVVLMLWSAWIDRHRAAC